MEHRHALDGIRGVAVAAVVVYHFAPGVLPAGFLGVDLFFVLSGFLITSLLLAERRRDGRIDVKAFWGRRARRLLPAALLTLAAVAAYTAVTASATGGLRADLLWSLGYANNWRQVAAGQSYFALFAAPSPIKHLWSLAIEEQFYAVWPLLFGGGAALAASLPRRMHGRPQRLIAGIAIGAAALASAALMWFLYSPGDDPTRVYYGTDTRAFELLIGALLAVVIGNPERVRHHRALTVAGTAAAIAGAVSFRSWSDSSDFYYRGGAVLWALGAALVIVAVLPGGPLARAFSLRPFRILGLISYGVYLFHFPVMVWVDETSVGLSGVWLFALRAAITLVVAIASYVLIESPIRHRRVLGRGWPAKVAAPAGALTVLLLIVMLVAPADDRPSLDLAGASDGPPNTAIVFSSGEVASAGPPATSEMEAIYAMAAWDAREKSQAASSTPPPPPAWTPPPLPPQAPLKQAMIQADISLVTTCAGRLMPPLAEYRNNGAGRLVAVIGDSMTSQMRQSLLNDRRFDWFILARCGTAIFQFDHPGARGGEGLPEAFAQLLFLDPQALIINLGITDVSRKLDYAPSMRSLIEMTKSIPCRSWVTLWPNQGVEKYMRGGAEIFQKFDDDLTEAVDGTDVKLLDWGARASQVPANQYGYHPWLNPADWVHLLPGPGFEQRALLMKTGLDGCFPGVT